jgi:hypothetical protein
MGDTWRFQKEKILWTLAFGVVCERRRSWALATFLSGNYGVLQRPLARIVVELTRVCPVQLCHVGTQWVIWVGMLQQHVQRH